MGFSKNTIKRAEYLWEINANSPSNTNTGTIPIFSIPAHTIIKSVGALVETITAEYAAAAFTAATSDLITFAAAHGFTTGVIGQASSTTTLPEGLEASTDYYVIRISATTIKLATSAANAEKGTAINITSTGTGTHTFTPTAFTVEVGDDTDPNGYITDGFTDVAGYYPNYDSFANTGAYNLATTGYALDKYYEDADTIDFIITGQASAGKVRFFVEFVELK